MQEGEVVKYKRNGFLPFVLYAGLMLILLFGRPRRVTGDAYWEQIQMGYNLKPLHTIRLYLPLLCREPESGLFRQAVVNLVGNVVMFIPLGMFLPACVKKSSFWKTLLIGAAVVCLIELLQLVTLLGCCDVDDLLLNLVGVGLGYGLFRLTKR